MLCKPKINMILSILSHTRARARRSPSFLPPSFYFWREKKILSSHSLINHQPVIRFVCIAFKCNFNVIFLPWCDRTFLVRSFARSLARCLSLFDFSVFFSHDISLRYVCCALIQCRSRYAWFIIDLLDIFICFFLPSLPSFIPLSPCVSQHSYE